MTRTHARHLRANQTDAERKLWLMLRQFRARGFHIRRQVAIGPYVADFLTHAPRLIVELDGSQHGDPHNLRHDAVRTAALEREGYAVMRFWNDEVFADVEAVARQIDAKLKDLAPYQHAVGAAKDAIVAPVLPKPPRSRATRKLPPRRATPTPNPSPQGGGE